MTRPPATPPGAVFLAASPAIAPPPPTLLPPLEALHYGQPAVSSAGADKTPVNRSAEEQLTIERAKTFLMQRKHLTEPEAHRFLQKRSMESGIRIVELARRLLQ